MDPIAEIKERISIYDLVSQYVELKRAGRNYKGLCPFHGEKTPSFMVSPEKGLAYCFGCNQGGDIIKFLELVEGLDFPEAVKKLAERAGVKLKAMPNQKVRQEQKDEQQRLVDLHKLAVRLYADQLWQTESGTKVRKYLEARGVSERTMRTFALGFAPDERQFFLTAGLNADYSQAEMLQAGLLTSRDTMASESYDRFRQRLMVPISDANNEVVAFGGRALSRDQEPKYLNSPETPIYHKSKVLFGFNLAKESMRKERIVYLVEGYFDVMAMHQAKVVNTVATCGTALTLEQVNLLKRFVDKIVLAFDADEAGQAALRRSLELVLRADLQVAVLTWEDGKDAADILKDSPSGLKKAVIDNTKSLLDYIWQQEFANRENVTDPDFQQRILDRYLPVLQATDSAVKKDLFVRKFAQFLRTQPRFLYEELERFQRQHRMPVREIEVNVAPDRQDFGFRITAEESFWAYLALNFGLVAELASELSQLEAAFGLKAVYNAVMNAYNSGRCDQSLSIADLELSEAVVERFNQIILYLEARQIDLWSNEQLLAELRRLLGRLRTDYRERRQRELIAAIAAAEEQGDKDLRKTLQQQYHQFLTS